MYGQTYEQQGVRREVVRLQGRVTLDGASAVSAAAAESPKLTGFSMARTGVGVFRITLRDKWVKLLGVNITVVAAAVAATAGREYFVSAEAVSAATPTIDVTFVRTDTGAAAEVTASAVLLVEVVLGNAE